LQTDLVGYDDGINWYLYCGNNPLGYVDPSGLGIISVATGGIMVLPHRLNPGSAMSANTVEQLARLSINLIEWSDLDDKDIRVKIAKMYLEALEEVAGCLTDIVEKDKNAWRAYIEIVDYNDTNDDGEIDEEDLEVDRYWIEVRGVQYPYYPFNDNSGWTESGYLTEEEAYRAAVVGFCWYSKGIPDNRLDDQFAGNPYGNEKYHISSKLSEQIKAINELIEELEELKG